MKSQACLSNKKLIGLLLLLLLLTILFIFLYYLIFQPFVTRFFLKTKDIHKGIDYWNSNEYIKFDSGDQFQKFVLSAEEAVPGQIVDFYHVDNHLRDNPIYGKMCDIFAVDIQIDEMQYTELINKSDLIYCGPICDYELYILPDYKSENEQFHGFVAICNASHIVRLIFLTDTEPEQFLSGYCTIILSQSSSDWWE